MTSTLLAAHFVVLLVALFGSRSAVPLFVANLCAAIGVLAYLGFHPHILAAPIDWQMVGLGTVEALVFVVSALGLRGFAIATMPSYAIFSVHFLIASAATAFSFLFRITRLF